jgi:hypothetical protein
MNWFVHCIGTDANGDLPACDRDRRYLPVRTAQWLEHRLDGSSARAVTGAAAG